MIPPNRVLAVLTAPGLALILHGAAIGLTAQTPGKPSAEEQAVLTVNARLDAAVLASEEWFGKK